MHSCVHVQRGTGEGLWAKGGKRFYSVHARMQMPGEEGAVEDLRCLKTLNRENPTSHPRDSLSVRAGWSERGLLWTSATKRFCMCAEARRGRGGSARWSRRGGRAGAT